MVKGLYTAYTGMINEQNRLDILSNNLANADTNGYKKEGATNQTFADELAIKIKDTSSYGMPHMKNLIFHTFSLSVHKAYLSFIVSAKHKKNLIFVTFSG